MWDRTRLSPFTQTTDSCILASYAAAVAKTAGVGDVRDFFRDYCGDFQLAPTPTSEHAYVADFQHRIRNAAGFTVIKALHDSSAAPSFHAARTIARVHHVSTVGHREAIGIEFMLEQLDAVSCLAVDSGGHSVVVGVDAEGPWVANTAAPGWSLATRKPLDQVSKLADALLVLFK